jgi:hypothetical protein
MIPERGQMTDFHCFIVPMEHDQCMTSMDETVHKEIEKFMLSTCSTLTTVYQSY